jgi:hypothetical protein
MKIKLLPLNNGMLLILLLLNISAIHANENLVNSFIEIDTGASDVDAGKIQGKMEINGNTYNAICECSPEADIGTIIPMGPHCDPSKLTTHMERQGVGASYEDIRNLIGDIGGLQYVSVPDSSFSCLDGRHTKAVLATPGGDAGEFILALSVYEDLLGGERKLTQDNVDNFLAQYLRKMKPTKFEMCTDQQSLSDLQEKMRIIGLNINNPMLQLVPELSGLLAKPEYIGDLHLKMMLKYPNQFAIRKEIVEMFITSFYKILWNKELDVSNKLNVKIIFI